MYELLTEKSNVFNAVDPTLVSEFVNEHVGSHSIAVSKIRNHAAHLRHQRYGELDITHLSYGHPVRVHSPRLEHVYHFQILLRGTCLLRTPEGEELMLSAGKLVPINPLDPIDLTYSADCAKLILSIPTRVFNRVCDEHQLLFPKDGIVFESTPYLLEQKIGLLNLLQLVCSESESSPRITLLQRQYTNTVAVKLMTLLDNNVNNARTDLPQALQTTLNYIHSHLQDDLNMKVLSRLAHCSERTLYTLFERHLSVSPAHYIRQRRLREIRDQLELSPRDRGHITSLALQYGFQNLGRFSATYRDFFGELPTETQRRTQDPYRHLP